jgi:hypothetical protein
MRKLVILAASVMALAVPAAGMAAVTHDDQNVGTVDKGDVMVKYGLNESQFQNIAKNNFGAFKFTGNAGYTLSTETVWKCGTGTNSQTSTVTYARPLTVKPVWNTAANKIIQFSLEGADLSEGNGIYVSGARTGAPYVGYCPAGKAFGGFLPHVFGGSNITLPGNVKVTYNGVTHELPVTPAPVLEPVA